MTSKAEISIQEIAKSPINLHTLELIEDVQEKAQYYIDLSKKEKDPIKSCRFFHLGDSLMEKLTKALCSR